MLNTRFLLLSILLLALIYYQSFGFSSPDYLKNRSWEEGLWILAIALFPFLFLKLRKLGSKIFSRFVLREKKKDIQEVTRGEMVLDLEFNNEKLNLSSLVSKLPDLLPFSFLYGAIYLVIIMIIAEKMKFLFLTRSSFFLLANLSIINLWLYYRKSIHALKEDQKMYLDFIHRDIILTPDTVAFAPYLFSPAIEDSYLYEEFLWSDIVRVRVRKDGIYSFVLNDDTHFNLDRNCFFTQEKTFLRYIMNNKKIPITLEDTLFGEADYLYLFGIHILKVLPLVVLILGIIGISLS